MLKINVISNYFFKPKATGAFQIPKELKQRTSLLYKSIEKDSFVSVVESHTGAKYAQTNRSIVDMLKLGTYPITFFRNIRGKNILDVGTGGGQIVLDMNKLGANAIGLDIAPSPNFKKYPKMFLVADAADTKLPEKSFDLIYSAWSIFSLGEDNIDFKIKALKELKRILKDNGKIRLGCVDSDEIAELAKEVGGLKIAESGKFANYNILRGWAELTKLKK